MSNPMMTSTIAISISVKPFCNLRMNSPSVDLSGSNPARFGAHICKMLPMRENRHLSNERRTGEGISLRI